MEPSAWVRVSWNNRAGMACAREPRGVPWRERRRWAFGEKTSSLPRHTDWWMRRRGNNGRRAPSLSNLRPHPPLNRYLALFVCLWVCFPHACSVSVFSSFSVAFSFLQVFLFVIHLNLPISSSLHIYYHIYICLSLSLYNSFILFTLKIKWTSVPMS